MHDPAKLIAPMLADLMDTDRAIARSRRASLSYRTEVIALGQQFEEIWRVLVTGKVDADIGSSARLMPNPTAINPLMTPRLASWRSTRGRCSGEMGFAFRRSLARVLSHND